MKNKQEEKRLTEEQEEIKKLAAQEAALKVEIEEREKVAREVKAEQEKMILELQELKRKQQEKMDSQRIQKENEEVNFKCLQV